MTYEIIHRTIYEYADAVSVSHHVARLTPRTLPYQRCLLCDIRVDPAPAVRAEHADYFGNEVTFLTVAGAHHELSIEARSRVDVTARPPFPETARAASAGMSSSGRLEIEKAPVEVMEYLFDSSGIRRQTAFAEYAAEGWDSKAPILETVRHLTARIHADFKFDSKATTVATPLDEFFKKRRGVCQDFAQFQIVCLRSLGIPARYVSGYLETVPPPGEPKLLGADASHAWVSFWTPDLGWIDVDPTNNLFPGERHITVAWGRDFNDVSPIRGVVLGGGDQSLRVAVDVIPASKAA